MMYLYIMPKLIRKHKTPSDKPVQKGRPKKLNIINDDEFREDETVNNNFVVVKVERGPHYIEL